MRIQQVQAPTNHRKLVQEVQYRQPQSQMRVTYGMKSENRTSFYLEKQHYIVSQHFQYVIMRMAKSTIAICYTKVNKSCLQEGQLLNKQHYSLRVKKFILAISQISSGNQRGLNNRLRGRMMMKLITVAKRTSRKNFTLLRYNLSLE